MILILGAPKKVLKFWKPPYSTQTDEGTTLLEVSGALDQLILDRYSEMDSFPSCSSFNWKHVFGANPLSQKMSHPKPPKTCYCRFL